MSIQKFANRALDGLSREYGIVGSIARTDGLDIAPPILVHDVSENVRASAWIACGLPGSGLLLNTGAAVTTVFAEVTRADALAASPAREILALLRLQPSEADIWVFGQHALATAATGANVASGAQGLRMPQAPAGTGLEVITNEYGTVQASIISGGPQPLLPLDDVPYYTQFALPLLLSDQGPSGFLARLTSNAGGAAAVQFFFYCYLGPKGSLPPVA